MLVQEAIAEGKRLLESSSAEALVDTPMLDASLLLGETLNKSRTDLIVSGKEPIAENDFKKFLGLLERRRSGECIAYILGRREFRGLDFAVNPNVLVPRPDTETLMEAALEYIDVTTKQGNSNPSLLDLCTGSGALAISLKNEHPHLNVTASDISAKALETAKQNAENLLPKMHGINFIKGDLFEKINCKFDLIISNPPYIPSGELSSLAPEVRREPRLALDGGGDGLKIIRRIISRSPDHLRGSGVLLMEAGPSQMPAIRALMEKNSFSGIRIYKDLAGRDRVIAATLCR